MAKRNLMPMTEAAFIDLMQKEVRGVDPLGRGSKAPAPTRTTSRPFAETVNEKPYMPVTDTSTPALEEGISFRQALTD
jgi:hypothetical protein